MKSRISASMMCADIMKMRETLGVFAKLGVEYLHIDVMDGKFVPNFTLGTDFCRMLRQNSDIPLDIHLMIEEPEYKINWFPIKAGDLVSVHAESTRHLQRALAAVKNAGASALAALNPATPLCAVEEVLHDVDAILLMTVNPGFAGQKMIPASLDKIRRLRAFLDEKGFDKVGIEVDGNVSFANAALMKRAGADLFVSGSSGLFDPSLPLERAVEDFRAAVAE